MGHHDKGKGKSYRWLVDHVDYAGNDCLQWPFARDGRVGRGMLGHNGEHHWAHRLMCQIAHGDPPTPKHHAAHNCGKGHYGCVNPRHLEWKTCSENQLDRRKNGNMLRNNHGNRGMLTEEQKAEIIALKGKMTMVEIAKKFGVSYGCVSYYHLVRGQRMTNPIKGRIDAALAAGPMPRYDLAMALFPGKPNAHAVLGQWIKHYEYDVRDGVVHPK